jgi:hypothetical protein
MVVGGLLEELVLSPFLGLRGKCRDLLGYRDVGLIEGRTFSGGHHDILEISTTGCVRINTFLERTGFQFVECE